MLIIYRRCFVLLGCVETQTRATMITRMHLHTLYSGTRTRTRTLTERSRHTGTQEDRQTEGQESTRRTERSARSIVHRGGRRWHTLQQQQDEQEEGGAGSVTTLVVLISTMPAASSIYSS